MLAEVYTPEGVELWLHGRNRTLDGWQPIDLIYGSNADRDRVLNAIGRLIEGNA